MIEHAQPVIMGPLETGLAWFGDMIPRCKAHAQKSRQAGQPIIGIVCEYAPRELIMAAGGVPVCLCGGDSDTIPAAEMRLPTNLCPLIKSTYGYLVEKSNPFLEMADLIVAETTCDGKLKMFELMSEEKTTYHIELPHKENDPEALGHWERELHKFKAFLENRYRTEITDAKLRVAIETMNRERALRRGLAETMKAEHPVLTGRQLLDFKSIISGIEDDLQQFERVLHWVQQQNGSDHPSVAKNGKPVRVLLTGVPTVHGAERVLEIIEAQGAVIVGQENCTGLKPILEDVEASAPDPIHALAKKYFHLPCSVHTPNTRRFESLRQLARQYRADCVIELIWQACLTYSIEAFKVQNLVQNELGLPYLRIETDYSSSDSARIATRVKALMETVQARRAA